LTFTNPADFSAGFFARLTASNTSSRRQPSKRVMFDPICSNKIPARGSAARKVAELPRP
jgi:hypothetical protein